MKKFYSVALDKNMHTCTCTWTCKLLKRLNFAILHVYMYFSTYNIPNSFCTYNAPTCSYVHVHAVFSKVDICF